MSVAFVNLDWAGRSIRIEHAWIASDQANGPLLVFLHEGLGSLAMWKEFPQQLCEAVGCQGLVYSRPGYGRSTPRELDEVWDPDFMHRQAHEVLPALLNALGVSRPVWLLGHSDGGSIALLFAARFAQQVAGLIVLAPHWFVEDKAIASIEQARQTFEDSVTADDGGLRQRLARHHDDVDSAFWGWNRIWLDSRFRSWRIDAELGSISVPLLAVQGLDDEYGTLEQIRGLQRLLPHTQLLELADCGHSPHRDQPQALIQAAALFIQQRGD